VLNEVKTAANPTLPPPSFPTTQHAVRRKSEDSKTKQSREPNINDDAQKRKGSRKEGSLKLLK
jgi:hypothetical protein